MKLVKKHIEYAGISNPSTPDELRIEILGLRNAARQADELISRCEQALEIARLAATKEEQDVAGEGTGTD